MAVFQNAPQSMGIHFMAMPGNPGMKMPLEAYEALTVLATEMAQMCRCTFRALNIQPDHVHILVEASEDHFIQLFFTGFLSRSEEIVQSWTSSQQPFSWAERVHVTIVPPWHIDMLVAFVRDQDYYHKTHSFVHEIESIFMRGASMDPSEDIYPNPHDKVVPS